MGFLVTVDLFASLRSGLEFDRDDFWTVAGDFHVHKTGGRDKLREAREAIIAGVEIRSLLRQMPADAAEVGAAVLIG